MTVLIYSPWWIVYNFKPQFPVLLQRVGNNECPKWEVFTERYRGKRYESSLCSSGLISTIVLPILIVITNNVPFRSTWLYFTFVFTTQNPIHSRVCGNCLKDRRPMDPVSILFVYPKISRDFLFWYCRF
jgi:hypothetical protein